LIGREDQLGAKTVGGSLLRVADQPDSPMPFGRRQFDGIKGADGVP
jgi:hypothetical protein